MTSGQREMERLTSDLAGRTQDAAPEREHCRLSGTKQTNFRVCHNDVMKQSPNMSCDRKKLSMFLLLRMATILSAAAILCMPTPSCARPQYAANVLRPQKFAMEPQDQTAIVGSRVTLPCRVIGKSGVLQWTKDDFGLGAHRNLSGYERYSMVGSDEEGDFSLDISPVLLEDDAKYQCQVSPGPQGQAGIRSRFAALSVLVPPEPPKIVQGPKLTATEDQEIELECISVGGKPAAEITWIDVDGNVISQNLQYSTEVLQDGRRVTARSSLRLAPKRSHHGKTLTCQAQNTADRTYRAATVHLEVRHAPVVSLVVPLDPKTGDRAREGVQLELECQVEANPSDVTYRWYMNDEPIVGNYTTKLVIPNVTRELHNAIVRCEVHNEVGRSEDSETLDVAYGPNFRTRPSDVEADLEATATLTCDVEGNPPPQILWLHEDQDRWSVVGRTPNLTLTLLHASSSGKYLCKATVQGFPEIEAEATVYLRGPPAVVSRRDQISAAGSTARVQCLAVAVPRPRVLWLLQGRPITAQDPEFSILEDVLPEGVRSTLVIRESQSKHFGSYNCSASNDYGTDVVEITLVAQGSFPRIIVIAGGIGIFIVIVSMLMVFVLCRRRTTPVEKPPGGVNGSVQNGSAGGQSNPGVVKQRPDVMADADRARTAGNGVDKRSRASDGSSCDLKLDLKGGENGDCEMEYRVGLPMSGLMPGTQNGLLLQYPRFSNEYIDPLFPPSSDYKDEHSYSGYATYVDYGREYSPAPLILQQPLTVIGSHDATRVQLSSLHSSHHLNHLNQLNAQLSSITCTTSAGGSSVSSSLARSSADTSSTAPCASAPNSHNGSLQRSMGDFKQAPNGETVYRNGNPMGCGANDLRHASLCNPQLRISAGLGTVNTANPAATPAPPPYTGPRAANLSVSGHAGSPCSAASTPPGPQSGPSPGPPTLGTPPPAQQASQYILPPSGSQQLVHLTKKGSGTQPALATHV